MSLPYGIQLGAGINIGAGIGFGASPPVSIAYIDLFGNNFSNPDVTLNYPGSLAYDSSNNLYAVGYTTNSGVNSGTVSKYNVNGALQWQRTLGTTSPSDTSFRGVDVDNSNNVYIIGSTASDGTIDGRDVQIVKYDTNGNLQWQKTLGSAGLNQEGFSIVVDKNTGDFYVGGMFLPATSFPQDFRILLLKYNSSGVLQWQRSLTPAVSSNQSTCHGIALDTTGNVYIVGDTTTTGFQGILVKYDSSGALQWQVGLSKATGQSGYNGITIDSSNNIFVCGYALTAPGGTSYGIVAKYNTSGVLQWKKQIGDSGGYPVLTDIVADSSGNIYTTGWGGVNHSSYTIKLDTSGSMLWQRNLSASSYWVSNYSIAIDSSNNIVTGGYSRSDAGSNNDIVMFKSPSDGTPTGTYTASGISFTYNTSSLPIADLSAWSTATSTMSNAQPSFTTATSTLTNATSTFTNSVTAII